MVYTKTVRQFLVMMLFKAFQIARSEKISGSGDFIIPNTCYTLTCSYQNTNFQDDRSTQYFIKKENNDDLASYSIRYVNSTGSCILTSPMLTPCTANVCSCDKDGMATHICYNHPQDVTGVILISCFAGANSNVSRIQVAESPGSNLRFNQTTDSVIKEVGHAISVVCLDDCNPPCNFRWLKGNSTVSTEATLQIHKLSKNDTGIYTCRSENGYGTPATKILNLTLNYGPEAVTILPFKLQYTVQEGRHILPINCTADCNPVCAYKWAGPNVPTGTFNILSLQNIQKNQSGAFNCTAFNTVGKLTSSDVNVNVQFGPGSSIQFKPATTPVTQKEGETLGPINCSATCNPTCRYTWIKPDTSTIPDGQLLLDALSIEDHGQYICTASNDIGDIRNRTLDVIVNYGPQSVTLDPPETHYTVIEGNAITDIICTADCRPGCINTWSGPHVPAGTHNVLRLQNIQRNQKGVFTCTAKNTVRSVNSSKLYLDVQFGPGSSLQFDRTNNTVTKKKGDQLGPIQCTATCNPNCEYKWTKPDKSIVNDGRLTIKTLSIDDHGIFICNASNGVGNSQHKNLYVTVNYGPVNVILSPPTKEYILSYGQNNHPINCTANCRPPCTHVWTGPNVLPGTVNVLILQNIQKNQSGDFICTASNKVGSTNSSINVDVQYKPDVNELTINGTNFTLRENTTATLSCIFKGNPAPIYTWEKNSIILTKAAESNGRSYYTIQPAQCVDSGNYSCVANNSLGVSSSQKSVFVTCSPRLNLELDQPSTKIGLPKGGNLNLTVHLIAYPIPISTVWSFSNKEMNETSITSYFETYELFKHVTILNKTNMTQFEFGDYILRVTNDVGTEIQTYHVVPQGPPDPVTLLNVTCGVTTAVLYWRTSFNGGETQNFSIVVHKDKKEPYIHATKIYDDEGGKIKYLSIKLSAGEYIFKIYGKNSYGNKTSLNQMGCAVTDEHTSGSSLPIGAAAGGGAVAAMFVVVMVVVFVLIKKRRRLKGDDGRRNLTTEDREDEDGLRDNPLYASSGEASVDSGQLYSVVNKEIKKNVKNMDQGPVYSQVIKKETKGKITTNLKNIKKTGTPGKVGKDMEMGSVYENSKNLTKTQEHDEVYSNTEYKEKNYRPTKNKDGLIYADLDLAPCAGGNKFVIRGLENKSNYAIIDPTKTAEPLPSDEEDAGEKSDEMVQNKFKDI